MTAVTNTGPLIVLAKLNHLHLLPALYGEVIVPHAVYRESIAVGQARGYHDAEATHSSVALLLVTPEPAPLADQTMIALTTSNIERTPKRCYAYTS